MPTKKQVRQVVPWTRRTCRTSYLRSYFAPFFVWLKKMNVPLAPDVTMSSVPSLLRSPIADVRADAGAVVDELRHELGAARRLRIADDLVDVHDRHAPVVRIRVLEVRVVTLAGDHVQNAVLVDVGERRRRAAA